MPDPTAVERLSVPLCRTRQQAMCQLLEQYNLDAALIRDRCHVHYLTGYWCRAVCSAVAWIERNGFVCLVVPFPVAEELACDSLVVYESNRLCTLVDDQPGVALRTLRESIREVQRAGCDGLVSADWQSAPSWFDLTPNIHRLRRTKQADEVGMIRQAILATEAAYAHAKRHLAAGVTEVELFAGMQMAAAAHAGEVLGEFGNDFQIGASGSAPRRRPAQDGEMAVFDLSVVRQGYRSDLCRGFVVGGNPSEAQLAAYDRIIHVFDRVESRIEPGVRCREIFQAAHEQLEGYRGWSFPHHLGHGIGLSAHEAPRLNPHWDDTFQIGDVFTVEPGLYSPELRAGLRIEHNYWLSEQGLVRLSQFPTEIA